MWFVYLLSNGEWQTYVGMTNDIGKRFHTHRCKLAAAARATKRWNGCILEAYISGIPDKRTALSLEWHCKRSRRNSTGNTKIIKFIQGCLHPKFKGLSLTVHLRDLTLRATLQNLLEMNI